MEVRSHMQDGLYWMSQTKRTAFPRILAAVAFEKSVCVHTGMCVCGRVRRETKEWEGVRDQEWETRQLNSKWVNVLVCLLCLTDNTLLSDWPLRPVPGQITQLWLFLTDLWHLVFRLLPSGAAPKSVSHYHSLGCSSDLGELICWSIST